MNFSHVLKYNPYHDEKGRFARGASAGKLYRGLAAGLSVSRAQYDAIKNHTITADELLGLIDTKNVGHHWAFEGKGPAWSGKDNGIGLAEVYAQTEDSFGSKWGEFVEYLFEQGDPKADIYLPVILEAAAPKGWHPDIDGNYDWDASIDPSKWNTLQLSSVRYHTGDEKWVVLPTSKKVTIRKLETIFKFNPNHHPAGSSRGGQFAPSKSKIMSLEEFAGPRPKEAWNTQNEDEWMAYTKRERDWRSYLELQVAEGNLSVREANSISDRVFYDEVKHLVPLPENLYHVTTAAEAVMAGGLKTRDQLRGNGRPNAGLGGGTSNTISLTSNKAYAENMLEVMREARKVARNEITVEDLIDNAVTGRDAQRPYIKDLVSFWDRKWREGTPYPEGLQAVITGVQRNHALYAYGEGWSSPDENGRVTRIRTPEQRNDDRGELYKRVLAMRQVAGGREDPLFAFNDFNALAQTKESDIQLLEFKAKPGTEGYHLPAEFEYRIFSGKDVELVKRKKSAFERTFKFNPNHDEKGRFATTNGGGRQVDTPAFRQWFKGSKVVDPNGKPLIVYHGTAEDFKSFDMEKGRGTAMSADEGGFFFATTPALASKFAQLAADAKGSGGAAGGDFDLFSPEPGDPDYVDPSGGNVMPVYLAIQNPKEVTAAEVMREDSDGMLHNSPHIMRQAIAAAKAQGYDGLKIVQYPEFFSNKEFFVEDQWVAFHPEQIKSAIGNRGTFDPRKKNITKLEAVFKFNPNHDKLGRFASAPGGADLREEFETGDWETLRKRMAEVGVTVSRVHEKISPIEEHAYPPSPYTHSSDQRAIRSWMHSIYRTKKHLHDKFGVPYLGPGNEHTVSFAGAFWDGGIAQSLTGQRNVAFSTYEIAPEKLRRFYEKGQERDYRMLVGEEPLGKYFGSPLTMQKGIEGFFDSVVRHEFGHSYTDGYIETIARNALFRSSERKPDGSYDGEKVVRMVSRYAITNQYEFAAEVFSKYTSPDYKEGTLTPVIEHLAKKMLKLARGERLYDSDIKDGGYTV